MQYVTAYGALIDIADLKSGETVVIPAASSRASTRQVNSSVHIGSLVETRWCKCMQLGL